MRKLAFQADSADGHPARRSDKYFFEDIDHAAALLAEAESWEGTPFVAYSKAKGPGGGVDCVRLCEAIMVATGAAEPFEFPQTPMDFTLHSDRSLVLEYLRGAYAGDLKQSKRLSRMFKEIPMPIGYLTIIPGDLLAFRVGRAVNHLTVALDHERFIHCLRPIGTVVATLQDSTFAPRLHAVFRARAKPLKS